MCTLFHTQNEEKSQKISTLVRIHTRVYPNTRWWGQICPPPSTIGLTSTPPPSTHPPTTSCNHSDPTESLASSCQCNKPKTFWRFPTAPPPSQFDILKVHPNPPNPCTSATRDTKPSVHMIVPVVLTPSHPLLTIEGKVSSCRTNGERSKTISPLLQFFSTSLLPASYASLQLCPTNQSTSSIRAKCHNDGDLT